MQVSRSGFYKWLRRQGFVTERQVQYEMLTMKIKKIFYSHKKRYGAIKINNELAKEGLNYSIKKVNKIMKKSNLVCLHTKKFKIVTTESKHSLPVANNELNRQFSATAPNQAWVADITYIKTLSGWLYLAIVLDLFSRRIVGYATSIRIDNNLVLNALDNALIRNKLSGTGLVFHSDRGVQYASNDFRRVIKDNNFVQSMSRKGNCWDNAPAESFFATLKKELIYPLGICTKFQIERELFEYIEAYYNTIRSHSYLGYKSPLEFENMHRAV